MWHWLVRMQKSCTFHRNKIIHRHNYCRCHWTSIQQNQYDFHHNVHVILHRLWFQPVFGINVTSISPLMLHQTIRNLASIHMSLHTIAKMPYHWIRQCNRMYQAHSVPPIRITCIWICPVDNGHSTTNGCRMDWMLRITLICGWRHAKSGIIPMQKVKCLAKPSPVIGIRTMHTVSLEFIVFIKFQIPFICMSLCALCIISITTEESIENVSPIECFICMHATQ